MRRLGPTSSEHALAALAEMQRAGHGLRLLLAQLPPGATLDDARRLREHLKQRGRKPSGLLDAATGVTR
jgi:hypothetical protein